MQLLTEKRTLKFQTQNGKNYIKYTKNSTIVQYKLIPLNKYVLKFCNTEIKNI